MPAPIPRSARPGSGVARVRRSVSAFQPGSLYSQPAVRFAKSLQDGTYGSPGFFARVGCSFASGFGVTVIVNQVPSASLRPFSVTVAAFSSKLGLQAGSAAASVRALRTPSKSSRSRNEGMPVCADVICSGVQWSFSSGATSCGQARASAGSVPSAGRCSVRPASIVRCVSSAGSTRIAPMTIARSSPNLRAAGPESSDPASQPAAPAE